MQLNDKVPVKHIKNPLLAKIVKKATEKNKSDRFSSVAELRVEIDKAADSHPSIISRYWKHGVATLLSSVACAAIIYMLTLPEPSDPTPNPKPTPTPKPTPAVIDYSKDFNQALAKLNSKDKNTAAEGLDLMKGLAEKNYSEAIEELGLTYCTFSKVQSSEIKERREILGLSENTSEIQSIQYLESIKADETMSIEALYILGYSYWRQHNWDKGSETLSKALEKLSKSSENSFNGKTKDDLMKDIKRYLNECEKQLRK